MSEAKLTHYQGSRATGCGKQFNWRLYITRKPSEVTCRRCLKAMGMTIPKSTNPAPAGR